MPEALYTIGLDYGSLSCRGVLVRLNGQIDAVADFSYPHGCFTDALPDGTPLSGSWCLQHPGDFVLGLETVVPALLAQSRVDPRQIIGIGVDFTASTVIPLDTGFRPLCENPAFASRPHAWCKMWKHHGAAAQAERLTEVCRARGFDLARYGGKISPECLIAKVLQVFEEDRAVYDAADAFVEAGDYLVSLLAGRPMFSAAMAAAKALWSKAGYPGADFWGAVHPELAHLPREKLADRFGVSPVTPGERAVELCPDMAYRLGLQPGIAVSAAQMDGYAPMPALGVTSPGQAMMVVGTSTAILLLHDAPCPVSGVTGCLPDTGCPGLVTYAAGQASVGDCFQWFADTCVPGRYAEDARARGMTVQQWLTHLAAGLAPGKTGLLALDWFNGNKSPFGNSRLKGMILGLNLKTKPEHFYRALLEASAFGARLILDTFTRAGVPISSVTACGGIAGKNSLLMQLYADVLGMPLRVSRCGQSPAIGMAIYAAVSAKERSGFRDMFSAAEAMRSRDETVYQPNPSAHRVYDALYREYAALADAFGNGRNGLMERLGELLLSPKV